MPPTGEFTIPDAGRARRVLVVDPDYDTLAALAAALRSRGIEVVLAADGRTGLERAVAASPEVVLVDVAVPLVDVRTFLEVLESNPRTASVPVFLMGRGDVSSLPFAELRDGAFGKPFQAEEVAARVEAILADRSQARAPHAPELQVRGDLGQVPLADILQVFAMNRRTGTFLLVLRAGPGEVAMRDGELCDARFGPAAGMKALVRMMRETGGQFQFVPDRAPARGNLQGSAEALIVEALRQSDEIERLRPELPPPQAIVFVPRRPTGASPPPPPSDDASREVLALAAEPRSLESIFDQSSWLDVETALVVSSLLRSGRLAVRSEGAARVPIADPDEMTTLRGRVVRARRAGTPGSARLLVPLPDAAAAMRLVGSLSWIAEFAPEPASLDGGVPMGSLGTLRLGEGVDVDLFAVPADPRLRPAWMPFASAGVGALVVASIDEETVARETTRFLREQAEVPVCVTAWAGAWPGTFAEGDLSADGLETPEGTAEIVREVLGRLGS